MSNKIVGWFKGLKGRSEWEEYDVFCEICGEKVGRMRSHVRESKRELIKEKPCHTIYVPLIFGGYTEGFLCTRCYQEFSKIFWQVMKYLKEKSIEVMLEPEDNCPTILIKDLPEDWRGELDKMLQCFQLVSKPQDKGPYGIEFYALPASGTGIYRIRIPLNTLFNHIRRKLGR